MGEDTWDSLYKLLLDTSIDDRIYRALADTRRRYTLYVLEEWGRVPVDELADILTGWMHSEEYRMATVSEREQLAVELREIHIPVLKDAGLVRYDDGKGILVLAELSPPVAQLIDWAQRNDRQNNQEPNVES
ncbi:DUF7344 domain-containing protein [Haladaptatus sp. DFWS20]|uniref:DUF7344 domain-containing protein n=1 Tax=Haladaptatus sp. DFWS20 TaxID=3403467 RepID=UPI003EC13B91